jgi:hypothetical protein
LSSLFPIKGRIILVFIVLYHSLSELENHGGGLVDCLFGSIPFVYDALGLVPIKIVDSRVGDELIVGKPPDEAPQITRRRNGWHKLIKDTRAANNK